MRYLYLIFFAQVLFFACSPKLQKDENNVSKWEDTFQNYEQQDQENQPPKDPILFVGSSSITIWKDINEYFPNHTVLNRGFGGSKFSDLIQHADRVIFPYKPSKVFIYEGDNDIASGMKPKQILKEARQLREMIRKELPGVPVVFISAKPSVSRWNIREKYEEFNKQLKSYAQKTENTMYADVYNPMLDENGVVYKHIFKEDSLHMNAQGYDIWQKALEPYLDASKKD